MTLIGSGATAAILCVVLWYGVRGRPAASELAVDSSTSGASPAGQPAAGAEIAPAPRDWLVQVDGQPPLKFAKPDLNVPIGSNLSKIVFPTTRSPFALISDASIGTLTLTVWDLREGRVVKSIKSDGYQLLNARLSADGAYVAVPGSGAAGQRAVIAVTSFATGKTREIEIGIQPSSAQFFDFGGLNQLVSRLDGPTSDLRVWNVETGEPSRTIPAAGASPESIAFSPGRNNMAWIENEQTLVVADLVADKIVGRAALPPAKSPDELGNAAFRCQAMAFSPDGRQLAGLFAAAPHGALLCWDVVTGRLTDHLRFEQDLQLAIDGAFACRDHALDWLDEGRGWLAFGCGIVDRKRGQLVYQLPNATFDTQFGPRRVVGNDRVALLTGSSNQRLLTFRPMDLGEAIQDAAARGGVPVAPRSLVESDITSAVVVAAPGNTARWAVLPDAARPAGPLAESIRLDVLGGRLGGVMVTPDAAHAVAWSGAGQMAALLTTRMKPDIVATTSIARYDLGTGQRSAAIALNSSSKVVAISPDARRIAVQPQNGGDDRIDIYSMSDGKSIASFRPYKTEQVKSVVAAMFTDANHLVTSGYSNPVVCWSLPDCRAVYRVNNHNSLGTTPGGKYLMVGNYNSVSFLEAATGRVAGVLAVGDFVAAAAVHPDGTRLAAMSRAGISTRLRIYNMADGQLMEAFSIPATSLPIEWCGDSYLLLDHKRIVDIQGQKVVWSYSADTARSLDGPLGRHWWVATEKPYDGEVCLSHAVLPDAETIDEVAAAKLEEESLLKAGMQVSLQVNLAALPPNQPNFANDVNFHYKQCLDRLGVIVAASAPLTFVVATSQSATEQSVRFRGIGSNQPEVEVPGTKVACKLSLISGGQTLWHHDIETTNHKMGLVSLRPDETIQDHLARQMWQAWSASVMQFTLPPKLYTEASNDGVGKSKFVFGGIERVR